MMKKITLAVFMTLTAAAFSGVAAQVAAPPGAGDSNLGDNTIKMRSAEIERVKRDGDKARTEEFGAVNAEIRTKFPQIKEDFENIQVQQAAIIKAYSTGDKIDYHLIGVSAANINDQAKRLDANLFAVKPPEKDGKAKTKPEKTLSVRNLIIELDNAIGSFVASRIFENLNVIDPGVAVTTRTDLTNIAELSKKLAQEADKMK